MRDRSVAGPTGLRMLRVGFVLGVGLLRVACPGVVRAEPLVPIAGSRPEVAAELAAEAAAPPPASLRMQLYLAPRNEAELRRLLRRQYDPASPDYHRWLSAAEYEARFGPTRADVDALSAWLETHGFAVTNADVAQGRIAFEGDVETASAAFQVTIAGSRDGRYYSNVADPMLPASLASKVRHIAGLHNASASVMDTQITDPKNNDGILTNHFGPTDVWTYSDERSLLDAGMNGAGQCIAALEGSDVDQASLDDFDTLFGLPPLVTGVNLATVYPDGAPGVAPPASQGSPPYAEALVDVEYAHGIAPGAQIVLYAGNFPALGTQGLVDTLKAATTDNRCGAITISWAQCGEPKSFFRMLNDSYTRGAAQGQSIFVATRDVGVGAPAFSRKTRGCVAPKKPGIEENAVSPNVTAIGATEISPPQFDASGNDTGVGVPAEAVWFIDVVEHRFKSASTGGVSAIFPKPRYQKGVKSAHFRKRAVPDICFGGGTASSPGYWECLDFGLYNTGVASGPNCAVGGGTSIAAPQWAGILAILMQKKGSRFGNINPLLYALAGANLGNLSAVGIRDVTQGNNGYYPLTGYVAGSGFDLASGWGSIDVAQFATAFTTFVPPRKK